MSLNDELQDRSSIVDLLFEYVECVDDRRFTDLPRLFTETGGIAFPGGRINAATELAARAASELGRYHRTQHVVSNQRVTVSGDRATLRAEALGTHVIEPGTPSKVAVVGGRYRCDLVRTEQGWLFETITPEYIWFAGEPLLH